MAASDRLDQLVELTGNISNAFTIALYKVNKVFNSVPLFAEGKPMRICAELEVSCFPDNGKTISQLIKASLCETTSKLFSKTTMTV